MEAFTDEQRLAVGVTGRIYQDIVEVYADTDRGRGRTRLSRLIDPTCAGVLDGLDGIAPARRTLPQRWADVLAYFEYRTSNGLTEAIDGRLEALRRHALGFCNLLTTDSVIAALRQSYPRNRRALKPESRSGATGQTRRRPLCAGIVRKGAGCGMSCIQFSHIGVATGFRRHIWNPSGPVFRVHTCQVHGHRAGRAHVRCAPVQVEQPRYDSTNLSSRLSILCDRRYSYSNGRSVDKKALAKP